MKETTKDKVLKMAHNLNVGGEYACVVGRRVWVCKNNGQFTRSRTNLPGWATFIGSFTYEGFLDWYAFQS